MTEKALTVEQMKRCFPCFTNGEHPEIDRLGIVVQLFEEMDSQQVRAALGYLNARFSELGQ